MVAKKKLTILDVRSPDDGASDVEWMNPVSALACSPRLTSTLLHLQVGGLGTVTAV